MSPARMMFEETAPVKGETSEQGPLGTCLIVLLGSTPSSGIRTNPAPPRRRCLQTLFGAVGGFFDALNGSGWVGWGEFIGWNHSAPPTTCEL